MTFERQKTTKRVLQDLKKRSAIGIYFYILLSFIVVFADDFYQRHLFFSMFFFLSNAGISLFRLIHLQVSRKIWESYDKLNKGIFFSSVIVTALIWGLTFALIMLQEGEHAAQLLIIVCTCGLCAGGVVAFNPHKMLSIIFNITMMMPAFITLLANGLNPTLSMMIFFYSVYMILIANKGNREYWHALSNEYLLETKSLEMARLSNLDVLTGLYNRRYFDDVLDREWKRSGRNNNQLSVMLLDIDHFKVINDTYGHQVGDEYLRKTAEVLTSIFKRDYDTVARYGGEEFVVLLPEINAEHARQLAEKVKQEIQSMTINYQAKSVRTTISSGIMCCIPDFNTRPDSIIFGADKALYTAKQKGRNRIVVFGAMSHSGELY